MSGYGTPIDPKDAPPRKPAGQASPVVVGTPVEMPPPASAPVLVRSVALGFSTAAEAPQLPQGISSRGSNFVSYQGGLIPRPGLSVVSSIRVEYVPTPAAGYYGWVGDLIDVYNFRYIYALAANKPAIYSVGSWSALSQTGALGLSGNTLVDAGGVYFDAVPYFNPASADFELVFVQGLGGAYTARGSSTIYPVPTFSTLTNAPAAYFVAPFDDRLVFASETSFGGTYGAVPNRVRWSARGNPQLYTSPDGGAEDLNSARGPITRLMATEDRLLVFFQGEIWQGLRAPFPFAFQFTQLHPAIGTRFSWSVTRTPYGTAFLGSDFKIYIIPPGGTPVAIGPSALRLIQDNVPRSANNSASVNAQYVEALSALLITYESRANGGAHGVFIHLEDSQRGQVDPIGFDIPSVSGWTIGRLGETSMGSNQVNYATGPQRVLLTSTASLGFVLELNSNATTDIGTAIDCRRLLVIENPDPTQKLFVRELRMDYRSASASSMSIRMTPDFGTTFVTDTGVALSPAPLSAQTRIGVSLPAIYPGIELRHASGQTFAIQGLSVVMESLGNG